MMRPRAFTPSTHAVVGALMLCAACSNQNRLRSGTDGGLRGDAAPDSASDGGTTTGDGSTAPMDDCAAEARWVYVLDSDEQLLRFEPDSLSLTPVGRIDCPGSVASPFSMSVDRSGHAWVLYQGGDLFQVSTRDASCTATSFASNQAGFELFGMGFASDTAGGSAETLFVAGGSGSIIGTGRSTLGRIDTRALSLNAIGGLPGWPELTGTGTGELWGFFPDTSPRSVRRIDKITAGTSDVIDLAALGSDQPSAWAFAFWGGRFYIFLMGQFATSTHVWEVDPGTGAADEVIRDSGYRIVGAGVSTCAPVMLI